MKLKANILSLQERELIHKESLAILRGVGVRYSSQAALKILEENGAEVDWHAQTAKISEAMIKKALDSSPKSFVLGARNPKNDFPVPSNRVGFTLDGTGTHVIDYDTGIRRSAVRQDDIHALEIFEQLPDATAVWLPVVPGDVNPWTQNTSGWVTAFQYSSKHIQAEICEKRQVPYFIEILKAVLGSEENIRERKIASVVYCPISPLTHDGEMLEANMELTRYHVPILIYPMAVNGSTGPASTYSCTSMTNAEILSGIVLFQLTEPGCPLMMGAASAPMDFHSGICVTGGPEMALQTGAIGEMARFYGIPTSVAGCSSDAKECGGQALIEKMAGLVPLLHSCPDLINGIGMFESAITLSLEQIVVDGELIRLCKRMVDGIDVSLEKDCLTDVMQVGPGGHFLKCKNTKTIARSDEFFVPELLSRDSYDTWKALGSPNLYTEAHKKVMQILRMGNTTPLPDGIVKKLEEIEQRADVELENRGK